MTQSAGVQPPSTAAERIRLGRRAVHLTQAQLAEDVGRSPGAVGQWEIGLSVPDETVLRRIARTLGRRGYRQPWWFYGGHDSDPHKAGNQPIRARKQHTHPEVTPGRLPVAA